MNARRKGLAYVNEVKSILKRTGHIIEGPAHSILWTTRGSIAVHTDFFGVWDLISFHPDQGYRFHQISTDQNKSTKIKEIAKLKMSGYVWGRTKVKNAVAYRRYWVDADGHTEEIETLYLKGG